MAMKCILHKDYIRDPDCNDYIERVSDEHAQKMVNGGHYIYVPKTGYKEAQKRKAAVK